MKTKYSIKILAINVLLSLMTLPIITFANAKVVQAPDLETKEMVVHVTGYSSTIDQTDDTPFIAANGTRVHDGVVAANFLPFGTKIKIPEVYGDKVFTVEDRMNKRYKDRVDIWFPNKKSATYFGHQVLKIQILEI